MLTKQQKAEQIKEGKKAISNSQSLVFIDFSGKTVEDLKKLRRVLLDIGAKLKVIKKKLLRGAFKESGIDFNPEQFESQVGTIFSDKDILGIAGPIYKSELKILGGYDLFAKNFIDAETVRKIGRLPSREILLGQLVGMISAPIKMFMHVLSEKSKMVENK